MQYQKQRLLFVLIFGLIMLACGIFDAPEEDQGSGGTVAESVEVESEAAEEPAEAQNEQTESGTQEQETQAAETAPQDEANAAGAEGETEAAPLEVEGIQDALETFSSYRWQFNMTYEGLDQEGVAEQGAVNMLVEAIKETAALHVRMEVEGDPAETLGSSAVIEIYSLGDTAYLRNPENGRWLSFPAAEFVEEFFANELPFPDQFVDLPSEARRNPSPETVNNISTWHYLFDESDMTDQNMALDEAKGEVWIAREGNYPVKLVLEATVRDAGAAAEAPIASGSLKMSYELLELNTDFAIDLPEEALGAESLDDQLDPVDLSEIDLPIMANAEVDFARQGLVSYVVEASLDEVVSFYRVELPNSGWVPDTSAEVITEESALFSFTKGDAQLSLIIAKEADGTTSVIMSTEE